MIHSVEVFLWETRVGVASFDEYSSAANFEYDKEFIESGIELSPIYMPLSTRVYSFPALNKESFKGLPGMLADSLPDKFGDAVIDAWLTSKRRSLESFTPIERLCYMGKRGMGALEYVPSLGPDVSKDNSIDIVTLFGYNLTIQSNTFSGQFVTEIRKYGLSQLNSFRMICQTCLNILIEQGIANKNSWQKKETDGDILL